MDHCWEHSWSLEALAPDSVGVHAPAVQGHAEMSANQWLPPGVHHGVRYEADHRISTGPFVGPMIWAACIHITVSPWFTVDSMRDVLHAKSAEVHFVVGGRRGSNTPVCIQCLPLHQFGKGLVHPGGTPETNRAWTVQMEICLRPEDVAGFTHYDALGNIWRLVMQRVPIENKLARSFHNQTRFTPVGFTRVRGFFGHMHVPHNDHVDPTTHFKGRRLVARTRTAPNHL